MTTILSLFDSENVVVRFLEISGLSTSVKEIIGRDITNLLPLSHSSQDYYSNATQGALLAFMTQLQAKQGVPLRYDEVRSAIVDLTAEQKQMFPDTSHRDYTQDGAAWTVANFPIYGENPEVAAIIQQFGTFMDFLKEGHEQGLALENSDYPEQPVESEAPEEAPTQEPDQVPEDDVATTDVEESEPVVLQEVAPVAEATVEDGVPQEALAGAES